MTRILQIISLIIVGLLLNKHLRSDASEPTPPLVKGRISSIEKIETREYLDMLEKGVPTSSLAVANQYTIVETYIDTCGICKALERQFDPFLAQRPDVVIRKVHFPEGAFSYKWSSPEEQRELFERMSLYLFNDVEKDGDSYMIGTCGTPHIEVYGPDQRLIAADDCSTESKAGLEYFRGWLAAEL
jgi:hypothetical protein